MPAALPYALVDFGGGRKLERFGDRLIDRPAPAAGSVPPRFPERWEGAARFTRSSAQRGAWAAPIALRDAWVVEWGGLRLELRLAPSGQVGVFPEQAGNWDWIFARAAAASRPLRVLNLFAYTGGATLAAARAGAMVTHVDAAGSAVAWARRNAEHSQLAGAAIRWIVDDALKFTARELARGRQYDALILDPPTYGHGAAGQAWKIDRDLPELLARCGRLMRGRSQFVQLTCHSPGWDAPRLARLLDETMTAHSCRGQARHESLWLHAGQRQLSAGEMARWAGA